MPLKEALVRNAPRFAAVVAAAGLVVALAPSATLAASGSQTGSARGGEAAAEDTKAPLLGGWSYYTDIAEEPLPEEAREALEEAVEDMVGSDIVPVALLGTQVVAGTNYAILCTCTPVVLEPETTLCVAIVYEDLQGNATLTSLEDFDIAAYNK